MKQWGVYMSELLSDIDKLKRVSTGLEHIIAQMHSDPYELIREKQFLDEVIFNMAKEIELYDNYIERMENGKH